ncbi:MAG: hypothetical protein Q4A66_07790 [Eubacteriales bacterium]|nr:hypothetical protein [Eubacteriales bacterium]
MAQQYIFTDANELVLLLKGKGGRESHVINSADIRRISFDTAPKKLLFFPVGSTRRIVIIVKTLGTVEFYESKHKEYFETYLDLLRAFCKENRVTFYDFANA